MSGLTIARIVVGAGYAVTLAGWVAAPAKCTQLILAINAELSSSDGVLLRTLEGLGVPPPYPNAVSAAWGIFSILLTLLTILVVVQPKQRARADQLRQKLEDARHEVDRLHGELLDLRHQTKQAAEDGSKKGEKPLRIFMEGAFDIMHYGHMNAFRQGAALGDVLVVGVNSSESIKESKGTSPVMNDEERCAAVRACRFVDEVVEKTPYVMTTEYLDWIIKTCVAAFVWAVVGGVVVAVVAVAAGAATASSVVAAAVAAVVKCRRASTSPPCFSLTCA